jgi:pimeloyl-ACP methyl ester carboxylesterase
MILKKLAISAAILGLALGGLALRLSQRHAQISAAFPPIGQFITVDGAKVHYRRTGQGPDIVLIHGASGNLREWEFGLRTALEHRFTVTAFDRPGHGYSDAIAQGAHLAAQAAHLRKAAAALGISAPVLMGHSYGGSVALAWALQSPPPAMMLISAPALPWPGRLDPWYRLTQSTLGRALAVPIAAALVPQSYVSRATDAVFAPQIAPPAYHTEFGAMLATRAPSLGANAGQVNALHSDITAQMAGYGGLTMPIALIHGDSDTIVPLHVHAAKLVDILPNARLTVLKGVGHMPHHAHLDVVLAQLDQILPR